MAEETRSSATAKSTARPSRASVNWRNGRIIRQKICPKRRKLDSPAYEYAQNKMAGVHVPRKIISRRTLWRPLCFTFIIICVSIWSVRLTITNSLSLNISLLHTYWFASTPQFHFHTHYSASLSISGSLFRVTFHWRHRHLPRVSPVTVWQCSVLFNNGKTPKPN